MTAVQLSRNNFSRARTHRRPGTTKRCVTHCSRRHPTFERRKPNQINPLSLASMSFRPRRDVSAIVPPSIRSIHVTIFCGAAEDVQLHAKKQSKKTPRPSSTSSSSSSSFVYKNVVVCMLALRLLARSCCYCMTAGWGATEMYWVLRLGAL